MPKLECLRGKIRIASIKEQVGYYQRELQHGLNLCGSIYRQHGHDKYYYESVQEYIGLLKKTLDEIGSKIDSLVLDDDNYVTDFKRIQQTIDNTPLAIHNILISALQRKETPIRHFSSIGFPSYSFGEAHPTYSSEITAIEKINIYFYSIIKRITAEYKLFAPLVCLSDKHEYAFAPITIKGRALGDMRISSGLFEEVRDYFTQSQILMPRWGPTNLRFAVFMAHEHFHPLIHLVEFCNREFDSREKEHGEKINIKITEELNERTKKNFGSGVHGMFTCFHDLLPTFNEMANEIVNAKGNKQYKGWKGDAIENAYKQLTELLCDLGALFLCGPAYVYAFISAFPMRKHFRGKEVFNDDHPPRPIRLHVMIKGLELSGYESTAVDLRKFFEANEYDKLCQKEFPEYMEWIDNCEEIFGIYLAALFDLSFGCLPDEGTFKAKRDDVVNRIGNNDFYLYDCTPFDLLNGMWEKMIVKPDKPGYHMRWRLAFKYCTAEAPD